MVHIEISFLLKWTQKQKNVRIKVMYLYNNEVSENESKKKIPFKIVSKVKYQKKKKIKIPRNNFNQGGEKSIC